MNTKFEHPPHYDSDQLEAKLALVVDMAEDYMMNGVDPQTAEQLALFDVSALTQIRECGFYLPHLYEASIEDN